MPSWHGCSLSERRRHGFSRGRDHSWITAPSGRSFDFTFVFERSLTAVPSWHGVILSARGKHARSRDRDGSDETAVWGPFGDSSRILECVGDWQRGEDLVETAWGGALGTTRRLLTFSITERTLSSWRNSTSPIRRRGHESTGNRPWIDGTAARRPCGDLIRVFERVGRWETGM